MVAAAQLGDRPTARMEKAQVIPSDDTMPLRPVAPTRLRPVPPAPVPPTAPPVGERQVAGPAQSRATAARPRTLRSSRSASLVAAATVTLAAVAGLGLAQSTEPGIPAETAVVWVGAGETVWDVARRVAPQSDQRAVVERIRQLNGIVGSTVAPGQQLQVPHGR